MNTPSPICSAMQALHPAIAQALAPFAPKQSSVKLIAPEWFNDDDIYVFDAFTRQLVREVSCKSPEIENARNRGLCVHANQSWARGLSAKRLGLWSAA